MLGFLRKNKEEQNTHTEVSHTTPSKKVEQALVWIDPAYRGSPSRILRGAALAQALRAQGVSNVILACPYLPMIVFLIADLQHVDVSAEENVKNLREAIKQYQPQLVIADLPAPMQSPLSLQGPAFCQFGEKFQENLFSANLVLLPGMVAPPNFEQMKLQASRMADCLHGMEYVALPQTYFNTPANAQKKEQTLLIVSNNSSAEQALKILHDVKTANSESIKVMLEGAESLRPTLVNEIGVGNVVQQEMSLEERLGLMDQVKVVLTPPLPIMYEFMARGSAVIFYPGNVREKSLCAYLEEQTIGLQWQEENTQEFLQNVLHDSSRLDHLREKSKSMLKRDGATRLAKVLVQRMEAWYALHG